MATFKIEELRGNDEMIVKSSQSKNRTGTGDTVGRLQYRGYRTRAETETLIKNALKEAGKPLKFSEVAEAVNRSANPFLRAILVDMTEAGEIVETVDMAPNQRLPRFWYALP
jgi:hypothetical protein